MTSEWIFLGFYCAHELERAGMTVLKSISASPVPPSMPASLTISSLAWVGGFRSSQRPKGNDDVINIKSFFSVLLRNMGQEFQLIW